jgi:plastocyanin
MISDISLLWLSPGVRNLSSSKCRGVLRRRQAINAMERGMRNSRIWYAVALTLVTAGCGGDTEKNDAGETDAGANNEALSLPATGKIIEVKMITDDKGNYYEPAAIHAEPGDVVRFTLVTGVHNVNFLADSNATTQGLPGPSELLQLPGQTHDVPVTFAKGSYYFHCDPHAMLGMIGRLHVDDDADD